MSVALVCVIASGCGDEAIFEDATAGSGVQFRHRNGMSGEMYFAEMMGGGVAVLDYDGDQDLDLFFVQGQPLGGDTGEPPVTQHALYRNDGDWQFTDVSAEAALVADGYAMGVAVGDVNNDGWPDIYVTAFGPNTLWLNRAGRFENVTQTAAAGDDRWSVSAAFVDFDLDGLLDLYVGNYVDYRMSNHKPCRSTTSRRDYCSPKVYTPQRDRLLRNLGSDADGVPVFADVTTAAGIGAASGGALGVVGADFNQDGLPDIYVANDGVANILWQGSADGRFANVAGMAGVAVNMTGAPEASMGLDASDFDADGDIDLFMTHLARESNTLYVNNGSGLFDDRSGSVGLAGPSLPFTGFGTRWFDYDGDGDLDLFSANGAVTQIQDLLDAGDPFPLGQTNLLLENRGGRYVDVSAEVPAIALARSVSRGLAVADIDNDGDVDLVIANNHGAPQLLRNQSAKQSWIGVVALGAEGGRYAIGAHVTLIDGDRPIMRRVRRDGSYASSSDPRVLLPAGESRVSVSIKWPDGREEIYAGLQPGRYHVISQSTRR